MISRFALFLLLLIPLVITGCADGNSSAPPDNQVHPSNWYSAHRAAAAPAAPNYVDCITCHGADLLGSGDAPSCFSASFDGLSCHAAGPGQAPHPIDGTYLNPINHGPDAKADLTSCQRCHSSNPTGGPGSNPRFNVGIDSQGGTGCEAAGCHAATYAHPVTWAGPTTDVFHYQAGNIDNACTLCHGVNLDGGVGVSCLNCHAEVATFALDCTTCHGYPPDGVTAEPEVAALSGQLVNHGDAVIVMGAHDQCALCHGVKSNDTATSGALSPNANYRAFDPLTETIGDHWNGQINMNGPSPSTGLGYNETDFGCDNASCHGNIDGRRLSDSALPVQFGDYGSVGAPHPLDPSFLAANAHGAAAKADLASCKACHGEATTTNPRYNVGIFANGCESCHNDQTAHPSQGTLMVTPRENVKWYDGTYRHSTGAKATFATACGVCHPGIGGSGTVAPDCTFCHVSNPVTNNNGCVSCHDNPPNGIAAPNRRGQHHRGVHSYDCDVCHTNAGPGSVDHFTRPATAGAYSRANLRPVTTINNMTISVGGSNVSCTGSCHRSHFWY